ncbi:MAG: 16S rRNA (cytosine(1402)-N(4))-methyltransferase RsmH [Gammaproteobacteria bacterium]|nr:16S rRNA (cytosine(1402)-N(4))-methyltransferase RsmH [Gammaproteobacteria bacterium]
MPHQPVMLPQALEQLAIKEDGIYVDCTFGRGGHSQGILDLLGAKGRLLALDRDYDAINSNTATLMRKDPRFILRHGRFSTLETWMKEADLIEKIDGIVMDLGVSSPQLDDPDRGFSFMRNGPLDMRMDNSADLSAADWLNQVSEQDLSRVLHEYGEERFANRIAQAIVKARAVRPIVTTRDLAELIENAGVKRDPYKHPATRVFQAIRIEINKELEELKTVLQQSINVLKHGGRLVVISFHSLEDRIVKQFIRNESGAKYDPGRLPVKQADIPQGRIIGKGKPLTAGALEIEQNPRARSAIMRVAEKR